MTDEQRAEKRREAAMYSPLTLAYLGDCVYELLVREMLVRKGNKPNGKLHGEATKFVSSKGQSEAFLKIEHILTEEEIAIFKRGRNAHSVPNKNNDADEYRRATGLETLFGYLRLCGDDDRIEELFREIIKDSEIF
ncbi:MAG: ribonuclease III [Clostridia bacterium]|nr:ribonuclease III [Clostridia bacterium]MBO5298953.1 ribonuclease III [Clostridia bacterium]